MEEELLQIVRSESDNESISMETPIEELGLDSLGILSLIQNMEEKTDELFPLRKIGEAHTVGGLICLALRH
jgi:acyl carrier protein